MNLEAYYGAIDVDTATELESIIERRRRERTRTHRERVAALAEALEE